MIQSFTFWLVLFVSVLFYWLLPAEFRLRFLAAVSFGYLLSLDSLSVMALLGWALAFHYGAWRKSPAVWLVVAILGYLAYFKYLPPLADAVLGRQSSPLLLPLGISFYTFRLIHYAVEASRGNIADRSLSTFLCYILLFPIFSAGPIERYDHFLKNIEPEFRSEFLVSGLSRINYGLIKRFAIVPLVAPPAGAEALLASLDGVSTPELWLFMIRTYLWIYLDFSAYTDLAVGASRLYGIGIMENFRLPVLAANISDFWKRWHMTLAGWCQSYVYLPLIGLTRNPYVAVYATFLVIGIWHEGSLSRVVWGLYHGTAICCHLTWTRLVRKRKWPLQSAPLRGLAWATTFLFVSSSFCFGGLEGHAALSAYQGLRLLARLFFVELPT